MKILVLTSKYGLPYIMMLWGIKPVYAEGTCKDNKWTTWTAKDHFQ